MVGKIMNKDYSNNKSHEGAHGLFETHYMFFLWPA